MLVPFGGNKSIHFGTGFDKLVIQLASGIAIILRIGGRVPDSEDGDFFALDVSVGERAVEPIVPGGSGALVFGVGVPGGGSYDEGVGGIDVVGGGVGNGLGFKTGSSSNVTSASLRVSGLSVIVNLDSIELSAKCRITGARDKRIGVGNSGNEKGGNEHHFLVVAG
mmetsp:Transcript_11354/g.11441  ORF Transcript_11354/g.11441 Transcript_11354/m.11441 type:complete len:166 (+) Transcript_11354:265-762(+)